MWSWVWKMGFQNYLRLSWWWWFVGNSSKTDAHKKIHESFYTRLDDAHYPGVGRRVGVVVGNQRREKYCLRAHEYLGGYKTRNRRNRSDKIAYLIIDKTKKKNRQFFFRLRENFSRRNNIRYEVYVHTNFHNHRSWSYH